MVGDITKPVIIHRSSTSFIIISNHIICYNVLFIFLLFPQVCLPDHDFPIGSQHTLIPSVYAGCVIKEKKVSFSGPTFISIRSQKHDSSTAESH